MLTRSARNEVTSEEAREKLAVMNSELANMNEELAKWNMEAHEAYQRLEASEQLLREANGELQRISNYDSLTGLHSRYHYAENRLRLEAEARRHEWYFWAISLDLDGLKAINDQFGHDAGDDFLRFFAKKMMELLRSTDLCARIGGDEFYIIGIDPEEGADKKLVFRILESMNLWFLEINGITIKVHASLGYHSKRFTKDSCDSIDEVVKIADNWMYSHKKAGGNGRKA